ncbi:hypothetical protein EAH73_08265 [Hymenobacter nivis]|uniref:Imm-5-like domain-containing protein n=2 Tax=Hymenobacter nivis TaxID=1850093 RepID=A0A502GVW4_9BACT|nr:hypothetical protein EAH73_08265 [Hymenobacter nivis]
MHHALALWAAACAARTLHLFEEDQPTDHRPQLALQAVQQWVQGERTVTECRAAAFAAHAAARATGNLAAVAAARATGHAAAVAHVPTHARYAGEYAAKAASLAVPSAEAAAAKASERARQWEQLRADLRAIGFPSGK